jgi:hypothetical protein
MRRLELKNSVLGQCDIFVFEFTIDRGPEITMDLHPFVVPIGPEGYSGRHLLRQQYPAKQWKWGPGLEKRRLSVSRWHWMRQFPGQAKREPSSPAPATLVYLVPGGTISSN